MPAIATYPGTVSPLRGLSAFTESEREVLYGRDNDVEALTRLVTGENFRAGLLHGEPGVGKTSLLRAGLVPHLRDHGYLALFCRDITRPIDSFVTELSSMTGQSPVEDETPFRFLTRVVAEAITGQLFIFILDDVEVAFEQGEQAISDLGNLFARVMGRRYGGRARFLFCCGSDNVYRFDALEHRTGSLFPPTNRYELERFSPAQAQLVLSRTLALAGVMADDVLARAIVESLALSGPILPADLQLAARGLLELGLTSPDALRDIGGPVELERAWLLAGADATGNRRTALRLLAELASDRRYVRSYNADWVAARASVDPAFTQHAMTVFADKGLALADTSDVNAPARYRLAHSILLARVRELAAPARESSRRAHDLLGSKIESGKRLSLREYRALETEGISPSTPEERAVIDRSKRFFYMIAGGILATPIAILVIIYLSMSGKYYLDVHTPSEGGAAHVVVRSGSPGLSAFNWLPGSPAFGSVVADTGFTRAMVTDDAWEESKDRSITGDLGSYADAAFEAMAPQYRYLFEYARSGSSDALDALSNNASENAQDMIGLLEALTPIARSEKAEIALVQSALKHNSPAVQRSALRMAASAAKRKDGAYHETLAKALTSPDGELRRLAFSAAKALGDDTARALYRAALATNPEPGPRRELLAKVTAADVATTPSAESAASILVNRDLPPSTREKARSLLERAFSTDAASASRSAAKLASDDKAPNEDRVLALRLMRDFAPEDTYADITAHVKEALAAKAESVRSAALPLYARIDPKDAATELVLLPDKGPMSGALKVATALAWGEIAKTKDRAAGASLELLIKDESNEVRAAAAEAYGNIGRAAQSELIKMVKKESFSVAVGAAYGLANSSKVGASTNAAVSGILQLWKRKGRARRRATEVFVKLARTKPKFVASYLSAAARNKEDSGLHVIGVRGLCNASGAGHRSSRRNLVRAAAHESLDVRRVVIECIVDTPSDVKTATSIASKMADERDVGIRTDATRVLAQLVTDGKTSKAVIAALAKLAADDERAIRMLAIRALTKVGTEQIPKKVQKTVSRVFSRTDEGEKMSLLSAAGALGATDLVQRAIVDEAPSVRIAALDTALSTGTNVSTIINAALTDTDRDVRSAALERLANNKDKLEAGALEKSLSLAIRDADREIAQLALTTLARLGDSDDVSKRLAHALRDKSEQQRVRAASACIGLVERDAETTVTLLSPLLDEPSHDVRAAMLPALATAWSATHTSEQLSAILRDAEDHAMTRITATAAFLVLARTPAGRDAASAELSKVADDGSPLVSSYAELGKGLIESSADGIEFLQLMTP